VSDLWLVEEYSGSGSDGVSDTAAVIFFEEELNDLNGIDIDFDPEHRRTGSGIGVVAIAIGVTVVAVRMSPVADLYARGKAVR
jgi:hypothetical protein